MPVEPLTSLGGGAAKNQAARYARNLEPAAEIGMTTVWIKTDAEWARSVDDTAHINFATSDLLAWLADVPPSN